MSLLSRVRALGWSGIARLAFAVCVICIEFLCRIVMYILPSRLLHNKLVPRFSVLGLFRESDHPSPTMEMTTTELIDYHGFISERHLVCTNDGYLLTLHRIVRASDEAPASTPKPPVFLMHGLMQSSETWVCVPEGLAFTLAKAGFDVWMGNTRGNKYSCKHEKLKPHQHEFWDFSVDEMGRFDVPQSIEYILRQTGFAKLGYVGFSQGTGQALACFSLQKHVAEKVNLFVALSPAAKARGLKQGMLQTLIQMAPQSLFLFFGTRAMLSTAEFWRSMLTRATYARLIDRSCRLLFAWNMDNVGDMSRKQLLYSHLFSFASVKTVVHWFQIAVCDRFQMYDENQNFSKGYQAISPLSYPIRQIACPMAIFYGSSDELTDIPWLLQKLPKGAPVYAIENYEHLDLMWAIDAHLRVFPTVAKLLNQAASGETILPATGGGEDTAEVTVVQEKTPRRRQSSRRNNAEHSS